MQNTHTTHTRSGRFERRRPCLGSTVEGPVTGAAITRFCNNARRTNTRCGVWRCRLAGLGLSYPTAGLRISLPNITILPFYSPGRLPAYKTCCYRHHHSSSRRRLRTPGTRWLFCPNNISPVWATIYNRRVLLFGSDADELVLYIPHALPCLLSFAQQARLRATCLP